MEIGEFGEQPLEKRPRRIDRNIHFRAEPDVFDIRVLFLHGASPFSFLWHCPIRAGAEHFSNEQIPCQFGKILIFAGKNAVVGHKMSRVRAYIFLMFQTPLSKDGWTVSSKFDGDERILNT